MNAPSIIPGILDEYCWMHEHPDGGWKCEICWLEIRLAAFFADVAMIARNGDTCPTPSTCQDFACAGHCAKRVAIGESEVEK